MSLKHIILLQKFKVSILIFLSLQLSRQLSVSNYLRLMLRQLHQRSYPILGMRNVGWKIQTLPPISFTLINHELYFLDQNSNAMQAWSVNWPLWMKQHSEKQTKTILSYNIMVILPISNYSYNLTHQLDLWCAPHYIANQKRDSSCES